MNAAIQQILTIYRNIMLPYAEGVQYAENWGGDFASKNASRSYARNDSIKVDFSELSSDEAELLGFPLWDDSGLRLVPLWLYDHIAIGQFLTGINGETKKVMGDYKEREGDNYMDNDHRGGATAWGFIPVDLRK